MPKGSTTRGILRCAIRGIFKEFSWKLRERQSERSVNGEHPAFDMHSKEETGGMPPPSSLYLM